jgi:hypothetical protein
MTDPNLCFIVRFEILDQLGADAVTVRAGFYPFLNVCVTCIIKLHSHLIPFAFS